MVSSFSTVAAGLQGQQRGYGRGGGSPPPSAVSEAVQPSPSPCPGALVNLVLPQPTRCPCTPAPPPPWTQQSDPHRNEQWAHTSPSFGKLASW